MSIVASIRLLFAAVFHAPRVKSGKSTVSARLRAERSESSFTAHYAGLDLVMTPGLGSALGDGVLFIWTVLEDGTLTGRYEVLKAASC